MPHNQDQLDQLLARLEILLKKQESFSEEVNALREEIYTLKSADASGEKQEEVQQNSVVDEGVELTPTKETYFVPAQQASVTSGAKDAAPDFRKKRKVKSDLEKFIGENLINKIGIGITVIGVGIGAKYAIDHQLISPLTRIILGYLVGLALLGFAFRLKKNYTNFSAVLLSGAMAILYFITYAGYSFYDLFPQGIAFGLMVVFTAFTVAAALNYNLQVIAHIGLVGAYAVPFLLSEDPGNVKVLFSYVAIINVGILVIAFKRYWKLLFYSSFLLTWLIYLFWYTFDYHTSEHFTFALTFACIFFATFYAIFLSYKLLQKEFFGFSDIVLLLANSFVFYGIGYTLLDQHTPGEQFLGLFTLGNACVHFIVSMVIYRQDLATRNLFFFVMGLVLIFITIAIPVQLDGNWVTLLWAGEAALLFWIGRTQHIATYENLSYPLMFLAFFSILHDYSMVYAGYSPDQPETRIALLLNINFLSSLLFIGAFACINFLHYNPKYTSPFGTDKFWTGLLSVVIAGIFLFTVYWAVRMEIYTYWSQLLADSVDTIQTAGDYYPGSHAHYDLRLFGNIWIINYSLLFLALVSLVNIRKLKNRGLGIVNLLLNTGVIVVFLTQGLYDLSELRENYIAQTSPEYYQMGILNIAIRYISFVFVGLLLWVSYSYIRQEFIRYRLQMAFDFLLHISILWIASSELIHWLDLSDSAQSYKFGLSILWGIYSLFLIALGIWKKKKYLRVGAIVIFAATLIKLFFYDITELDTISKTIVFVSLGVLLLIISFLYHKYKNVISAE